MNTPWLARAAVSVLFLSIVALVVVLGGSRAILYGVLFALSTMPGWPIGVALFGRRHPAGWVAGVLIGYALISLVWWAVVFFDAVSTTAFAGSWAVATLLTVGAMLLVGRTGSGRDSRQPLVSLPRW